MNYDSEKDENTLPVRLARIFLFGFMFFFLLV